MKPLHIYCLTDAGGSGGSGYGDDVWHLTYEQVGMVVGPSPGVDYKALPKDELVRRLAAHQAVIERVMEASETVVPVRFGTEVASEEEALEILQQGAATIRAPLERMAGHIQLELVVLWEDLNRVLREVAEDTSIRRMKEAFVPGSPDSSAARVEVGKKVKALLDKRRERCAEEILGCLTVAAEDCRRHAPMDDHMVLNAAFLLKRAQREAFEKQVEDIDRRFQDRLRFRIVGPLPPHSFSTVEIQRPDFEAIERARKTLGLPDTATLAEVKEANRRLTREHHPDKAGASGKEKDRFEGISAAYRLLSDYCRNYRYSFREADVGRGFLIQTVSFEDDERSDVKGNSAEPIG